MYLLLFFSMKTYCLKNVVLICNASPIFHFSEESYEIIG